MAATALADLQAALPRDDLAQLTRVHGHRSLTVWAAACRYDYMIDACKSPPQWDGIVKRVETMLANAKARDMFKARPDCYASIVLDQTRAYMHLNKPTNAKKNFAMIATMPNIRSHSGFYKLFTIVEAQIGDAVKVRKVLDVCKDKMQAEDWYRNAEQFLASGPTGIEMIANMNFDDFSFPWLEEMLQEAAKMKLEQSPAAPPAVVPPALPRPVAAPVAPPVVGPSTASARPGMVPVRRNSLFAPSSSSFVSSLSPVREEKEKGRAAGGPGAGAAVGQGRTGGLEEEGDGDTTSGNSTTASSLTASSLASTTRHTTVLPGPGAGANTSTTTFGTGPGGEQARGMGMAASTPASAAKAPFCPDYIRSWNPAAGRAAGPGTASGPGAAPGANLPRPVGPAGRPSVGGSSTAGTSLADPGLAPANPAALASFLSSLDADPAGSDRAAGGDDGQGTVVLQKGGAKAQAARRLGPPSRVAAAPAPVPVPNDRPAGEEDGPTVVFQPRAQRQTQQAAPQVVELQAPVAQAAAPAPVRPPPQPSPPARAPAYGAHHHNSSSVLDESSFDAEVDTDQARHRAQQARAQAQQARLAAQQQQPPKPQQQPQQAALPRPGSFPQVQQALAQPVPQAQAVDEDGPGSSTGAPSSLHGPFDSLTSTHEVVRVGTRSYLRLTCIGRGGSSRVYRVLGEDMGTYALKRVRLPRMDAATVEPYRNEIALLKKLNSGPGARHIIRLLDAEVDYPGRVIHMVMEAGQADLNAVLSAERERAVATAAAAGLPAPRLCVDENVLRVTWAQMLAAVQAIHDARVVHGDLKPANFVFVEGVLKLIDFGIAKAIKDDTTNIVREATMGTLNYMSPEAIQDTTGAGMGMGRGPVLKLGRASDIWSLGCILFQMVYGRTPFADLPLIPKLHAICDPSTPIPLLDTSPAQGQGQGAAGLGAHGNSDLEEVLRSCLQRDPCRRPPIAGAGGLLEHPFLRPRRTVVQQTVVQQVQGPSLPVDSVVLPQAGLRALVEGAVAMGVTGSALPAPARAQLVEQLLASLAAAAGQAAPEAGLQQAQVQEACAGAMRSATAMVQHAQAQQAPAAGPSAGPAVFPGRGPNPMSSVFAAAAAAAHTRTQGAEGGAANDENAAPRATAPARTTASAPVSRSGSVAPPAPARPGGLPLDGPGLQRAISALRKVPGPEAKAGQGQAGALPRPHDKENMPSGPTAKAVAPAAPVAVDGGLAAALRRGLETKFARVQAVVDDSTLGPDATWS